MNKIFFDAEFINIEAKEIKFVSLALIKENGDFIYLKIKQNKKEISKWVLENVMPNIENCDLCNGSGSRNCGNIHPIPKGCYRCNGTGKENQFYSEKEARNKILEFLDNEKFQMVADVNQFDWIGWCRLMGGYF